MLCLRTKLHMPNAKDSLLISNILLTKEHFRSDAMILRNKLQDIL